jgi:hypothetical protein
VSKAMKCSPRVAHRRVAPEWTVSLMRRTLAAAVAAICLAPAPAAAQSPDADVEARIRSALSAAPPSVAAGATVVDHQNNVLRKGTNGWTCMPDDPGVPNNSPMCLDAPWLELIGALMSKRPPKVSGMGIGYMLQEDLPVSNTDPFATGPSPTNQWLQNGGPHIMLVVPDLSLLAGLSTDSRNGGPWVMWHGTPYAHIMIPAVPRQR